MKFLKCHIALSLEADNAIYAMLKENKLPVEHIKKIYSFPDNEGGELCMALNIQTSSTIVDNIRSSHEKVLLMAKYFHCFC